ncbi:MAG: HAMP domain-containing histidine kinase [Bacteroidales bacterium]|nr:HAMP domain-containing histidine kinase [Bacteroidales bacterium]
MKKQIFYILVLIIISVSGILAIQFFWIYNSYKINRMQFIKEIDQALEVSVQTEMNARYSEMVNFMFSSDDITILKTQPDTVNGVSIDSLLQEAMATDQSGESSTSMNINIIPQGTDSASTVPDYIGLDIKNLLRTIFVEELQGKTSLNFEMLDSLLQIEFKNRNIESPYIIELMDTEKDSLIKTNRGQTVTTKKIQGPKDLTVTVSHIETHDEKTIATKNILRSKDVPVSVLNKTHVRLGFPKQRQVILSQMAGILGASFLLVVIVVLCFIYMLRTILKQKKLSEIKNDFINNMTHELKTPIATVSAAVESMQNFNVLEDKSKTERYLDISSKELKRLSGLVEKVLNISAYEQKTLKLNPEKIDFNELIQNIITSQSIKNSDKKVEIEYIAKTENKFIIADRIHLTNVMNNLIDNAIKYSNNEVNIEVTFDQQNNHSTIRVKDNGLGISKHNQSKIFEKFYRVPTGNIHKVKGFGLGLHYVKSIIEEQQGTVEVKSTFGKGSEFLITLP